MSDVMAVYCIVLFVLGAIAVGKNSIPGAIIIGLLLLGISVETAGNSVQKAIQQDSAKEGESNDTH